MYLGVIMLVANETFTPLDFQVREFPVRSDGRIVRLEIVGYQGSQVERLDICNAMELRKTVAMT